MNNALPQDNSGSLTAKISPQFQARLRGLSTGARIRALIVVGVEGVNSSGKLPRTREERQAVAQAARAVAETALPEIDAILDHYAGKRLAEYPTVLGTIPVETTRDGIQALANSERVKTILEDQPILPLLQVRAS